MINLAASPGYRHKKISGFTLLELMAVLLLLSILLTLAIYSGRGMWVENRSSVTLNGLLRALNYARSAAILQGEPVTICASSDQKTCNTTDWSKGQLVLKSSGELLRLFSGLALEDRLIWNSSLNKDDAIRWLPTGYASGQHGSFYYCAGNSLLANSGKVVLSNTGRLYSAAMTAAEYHKFCESKDTLHFAINN